MPVQSGEGRQQAVTKRATRRTTGASLRNRILAIALVPSLSLLVLGAATAGYFAYEGFRKQDFANRLSEATPAINQLMVALQEERRASMAVVVQGAGQRGDMLQQRQLTDT